MRHSFCGDMASWVMDAGAATTSTGGLTGDFAVAIPYQAVTFWDSETGGSQLTDLLDANGNPVTSVTSASDGSLPQISGPDGITSMWADAGGGVGPRRLTVATDLGSLAGAGTGWVNAAAAYGADPAGSIDSTSAIQAALLSFGTATGWTQGKGGVVYLPAGRYTVSNTLILPPGVALTGDGPWSTIIIMSDSVAADIIQTETYQSAAQATILAATAPSAGLAAANLVNAFFCRIENLGLHGNAFYTTVAGYSHGISMVTSPLTSAAPGDPQFDPSHHVGNVYIEACTGDGIFQNGRSANTFSNIWSLSNNGNGITPSFDSLFTNCNVGFNGICGIYNNHTSTSGSSVKCYNNGQCPTWVSGTSYAAGDTALYSGILYFCVAAVSGTTAPSSDTTHWTALTATSPAAWGCDWYWDGSAYGQTWTSVASQEPSAYGYYFNDSGSITVTGTAYQPNYNQGTSALNTSNPDSYAAAYFSPSSGAINLTLSLGAQGNVSYALSVQPGSTENCIIVNTDGSQQGIFAPGSPSAGNLIIVNGQLQSSADIAGVGQGLKVAEGSNAKQGTVTMNGTTAVTVANTSVTANSRIFLTVQSPGGVTPGMPYVAGRTAGTSFQVKSAVASDNSVVAYEIIEPG